MAEKHTLRSELDRAPGLVLVVWAALGSERVERAGLHVQWDAQRPG